MAKPRREIDETTLYNLAVRGLPRREIARIVGCDEKTLRYRFAAILEKGYADGSSALLASAYTRALRGSEPLLRFLLTKRMPKEYGERIQVEMPGDVLPGELTVEMLMEKFAGIMQEIKSLPTIKVASPKLLEGREVRK